MVTDLQQLEGFKAQIGVPYDYLQLIDKLPISDIITMLENDIQETKKTWIHPTINITYRNMASAGNWKVNNLKAQKASLVSIQKGKEATAAKLEEVNAQLPKDEPLSIINEMQSETKPDYSRALIIGGVVFTGLMLLLIWRLGK